MGKGFTDRIFSLDLGSDRRLVVGYSIGFLRNYLDRSMANPPQRTEIDKSRPNVEFERAGVAQRLLGGPSGLEQ